MKVSLVIPAYNEEVRLAPFLSSINRYASRHRQDIREVIIVDDGSSDKTVAVTQSYQKRIASLRVIKHEVNKGKGAAVQTGVMAARGDVVVFMDADGATAITELPKMIAAIEDTDIAIGNRWMRGANTDRHSTLRQLSGWTYRTYMKFFGLGKEDTMCGFKGYKLKVAQDLFKDLLESRWLFDTEIAYRARLRGYTVKNFPIRWNSMEGSKLSTFTLLKTAFGIWPLIRRVKKQEKLLASQVKTAA